MLQVQVSIYYVEDTEKDNAENVTENVNDATKRVRDEIRMSTFHFINISCLFRILVMIAVCFHLSNNSCLFTFVR